MFLKRGHSRGYHSSDLVGGFCDSGDCSYMYTYILYLLVILLVFLQSVFTSCVSVHAPCFLIIRPEKRRFNNHGAAVILEGLLAQECIS